MLNIYFHEDFDGVVSASLFTIIMKKLGTHKNFNYISVDYEQKDLWGSLELKKPCAILDFLFHNDADYYFDHHTTSFSKFPIRDVGRNSQNFRWDPSFYSTPSLLKDSFKQLNVFDEFEEIINWSDIIDSAKYVHPSDLYDYSKKYIVLNKIISYYKSKNMTQSIVEIIDYIINRDIDKYLEDNKNLLDNIINIESRLLLRLKNKMVVKNNICIFNQADELLEYQRYLPYFFFNTIDYTIGIYRRNENYALSIGYNPWKNNNMIELGEISKKYNGGGRKNVAGIIVKSYEDSLRIADNLYNEILKLKSE